MTAGGDDKPVDLSALGAALPGRPNLTDEDRAGLMSAIQDKLDSLAAGALEALSPAVKARVVALQELQKNHNELHGKFLEEKAALEKKYQQLYQPLYTQRFDIVNGVVDPAAGEKAAAEGAEVEKGVPEFWLTAMKNNEILVEQITARDEGALKHLRDITWAPLEGDAKGFKLIFHFDTNPYFSNTTLTKSYFMIDEEEPILEKAEGTEINWLPGKNLTVKVLKKKPKKGAGKNAKPITKTEPCESFFNFFSPPSVPTEDEELEEEEAEELQELMEQDYDIGSTLKEKIIPQAVSWYTGEAAELEEEYDEDDEEDDEEDEEGEDDEEDDEDEDEEDDDDDDDGKQGKKSKSPAIKKVRKKAAGAGAAGAAGEQPAECKQQ